MRLFRPHEERGESYKVEHIGDLAPDANTLQVR